MIILSIFEARTNLVCLFPCLLLNLAFRLVKVELFSLLFSVKERKLGNLIFGWFLYWVLELEKMIFFASFLFNCL